MELSGQILEAAAHSMYHGTLSQQQEAAALFATWQNSNNALITASQFLTGGSSDTLQFVTCCVILYASDQWFKYDREMLNEIRQLILRFTFEQQHSQLINSKLEEIIAKIAFNDWPEQWPNFLADLIFFINPNSSQNDSTSNHDSIYLRNSQIRVFMILSHFLRMIFCSTKITLRRRAFMIHEFMSHLPSIFELIDFSKSDENSPEIAQSFLEFAEAVCLIITNDETMVASVSQFIFTHFAVIDIFAEKALKAISTLFSPNNYLTNLIPLMISFVQSKEESHQQISLPFHEFICIFMRKFINIADKFCTNDESISSIQKLLQTTLIYSSRETFSKHFWALWSELLEKVANNNQNHNLNNHTNINPNYTSTSYNHIVNSSTINNNIGNNDASFYNTMKMMLPPLLPLVLTTFYELLPCSSNLSRLISPTTSSAVQNLVKITPQETFSFLSTQPPCLPLCFAVGIIHGDPLRQKLAEIVESYVAAHDLQSFSALLYCVSRNTEIMKNEPALISLLQQLTLTYLYHDTTPSSSPTTNNSLNDSLNSSLNAPVESAPGENDISDCNRDEEEGGSYQTSLLLALNHVASNFPNALTSSQQFIDLLFECASPERLPPSDFARLCRILAKVIMTTPPSVKIQYIERLVNIAAIPFMSATTVQTQTPTAAVSTVINSNNNLTSNTISSGQNNAGVPPAGMIDVGKINVGLQAAWAICSISLCGAYLITKHLWKPLLYVMSIASGEENESLFSDIIAAFASSVRSAPWNHCYKAIHEFISIALNSSYLNEHCSTAVLDAFNMMYQCHYDLSDMRETFANTFVQKMASCPQPSFFEFFSIAGIKEHEQQVVVEAACHSLKDPDVNISRTAAHMLKTLVNKQKDQMFVERWQGLIVISVFEALFDNLHHNLIPQLSKVLFAIYKKHIRRNTLSPAIDTIIIHSIVEEIGDQSVTVSFASALRNTANSRENFIQLINDFLISFGRFNPHEIKLFDETLNVSSSIVERNMETTLPMEVRMTQLENAVSVMHNEDEYATHLL
ncbi:hypothetical protein TRFO_29276 [Tritrichomonas foetus]|uniref:Exportin-1/Importin-beta-like domain-containing protein n=1 Tax=Tritrichomonas foetus TaxID=1144522 RepID=A0A1J4JWH9_9EUKA|nr:hypothetical protein TRFO_29276 [Tritrichomonas foetus]|eukprot:OHT03355.1 hypothetical protein TRFO_29276 [Tritrichomonas foetus]